MGKAKKKKKVSKPKKNPLVEDGLPCAQMHRKIIY